MKSILISIIFSFSLLFLPVSAASDETGQIISRMSLAQKVGQIMFVGFQGPKLTAGDAQHLQKIHPGGIVFYGRNFREGGDITLLVPAVRAALREKDIPLFLAVDQEGGIVHRVEGELLKPPSHPAIGAAHSEFLSRAVGQAVGRALRDLGLNVNLAPVLDMPAQDFLSPMSMRSLGSDARMVEALGRAYIQGIQKSGLLATAKHFPGLGRAREDSHFKLPRVQWKTEEERARDLAPFRGAVKDGVDLVMVGHFVAEPGDGQNPISLSRYWMEEVLRKEMGYSGLVIVDNMEMKALEKILSLPEAVVKAFNAGADILMVSHEKKNQEIVFQALARAVEKGTISKERLDASLRRILERKKTSQLPPPDVQFQPDLKSVSRMVAENSLSVIRRKNVFLLRADREEPALYVGFDLAFFSAFRNMFPRGEILNTSLAAFEKSSQVPLRDFLEKFNLLLIDSSYAQARQVISTAEDLNRPSVVIGHPTHLSKVLESLRPSEVLVLFDHSPAQIQVALEVLCGLREGKGRFPFPLHMPEDYTY